MDFDNLLPGQTKTIEMMENKENKRIYASEARTKAEAKQSTNLDFAFNMINDAANAGFTEAILFGQNINLSGVAELMGMGYAVSTFLHPFEQRIMYKVSW